MNATKTSLIAAIVGLFGAVTFTAQAQDSAETLHADAPAFEELDTNEDGVIAPDEAKGTWLEGSFTQVDVNRDGYVTKTEYQEAIS